MILAIISHTQHYIDSKNKLVGWGATVREIDNLTSIFEKVIHIAPLHEYPAPSGMLSYQSNRVEFVSLKPTGGKTFFEKFGVIAKASHNLSKIKKKLRECDIFQFRAPTGIGLYVIPYLMFSSKKGWYKYAGNWVQEDPPLGYRLQRFLLSRQNERVVTINGKWLGQKPNQLSFENPCLTLQEREGGLRAIEEKDYSGKLDFVFIGRLEDTKGVQRILNVFSKLDNERIGKIHFVGDSEIRSEYEHFAHEKCKHKIIFHGFLSRSSINEILERTHCFLLPSASEGFPKVIAEAANYGLIPVVSDVSSIGQYIKEGVTGYLVEKADEIILQRKIEQIFENDAATLKKIANNCYIMASNFTYEYYNKRIKEEIVGWE